jgi:hypothetical protein
MQTKKTTLSIQDLRELHVELTGVPNGFPGLLSEKLPFKLRYYLSKVSGIALDEFTKSESIRLDLVRKYGTLDNNNNFVIEPTIEDDGKVLENTDYQTFIKDWIDVISKEIEVEHYDFKIEDFNNLETNFNYRVIFLIISL